MITLTIVISQGLMESFDHCVERRKQQQEV
jgi:hypothetical protein